MSQKPSQNAFDQRLRDLEQQCFELKQSNRALNALLNAAEESAILGDTHKAVVLACNTKAAERVGMSVDELVGLSMYDYLPADLAESRKQQGDQVVRSGKPIHFQDAREGRTYDNTINPVFDEEGRVVALAIYARDITNVLQLREDLHESEKKFGTLAEQLPNMIFINSAGRVTYVNPSCETTMGYRRDEFYASDFDFRCLIAPGYRERVENNFRAHARGENVEAYECGLVTKDGRRLDVILSTRLVDFEHEQSILGIMTDITDRKRIHNALQESERRYRQLIELGPDAIVVLQGDRYEMVNSAFTKIFGYTQKDVQAGLNFFDLVQPSDRQGVLKRYEDQLKGKPMPKIYRINLVAKDGQVIACETSAVLIDYKGQPAVLCIIRDIRERQRTRKTLEKKEAEIRAKAKSLEEMNTALRVLLKEKDVNKTELEEKVLANVRELALPYLERIRQASSGKDRLAYVDILESTLKEIVSPFPRKLSSQYLALTPKEIQVADLVKAGKTTKEIAGLMNLSSKTVEFHREKIRKKLGIKNTKVNLRTHLLYM